MAPVCVDAEAWAQLDTLYTLTLFYLAQVYTMLEQGDKAAIYCRQTLQRQLEHKVEFTPAQWCTNCIGLSYYAVEHGQLRQAHHDLTTVLAVLPKASFPIPMNHMDNVNTPLETAAADCARAWGRFHLEWLERSRDMMQAKTLQAMGETVQLPALPTPHFLRFAGWSSSPLRDPPACGLAQSVKAARGIYNKGLKVYNASYDPYCPAVLFCDVM